MVGARNSISILESSFVTWLKGLTAKEYVFGAAILLFLALFIVGICLFAKMSNRSSRFRHKLQDPNRMTKVIVINYPRQEVTSFPLRNIGKKKVQTFSSFLSLFPSVERASISEWLNSILNGTNNVPYMEYNSGKRTRKSQSPFRSFLRLVDADPTTGIIHLESYPIDKSFRVRSSRKMLSSESELAESLKANGFASGMTFCFKLIKKERPSQSKNKNQSRIDIEKRFIDYISRYAVGSQKVLNVATNEVAIANFSFNDLSEGMLFALEVIHDVTEKLISDIKESSKVSPHIQIKCGIVVNKDCLGDSDLILREASSSVNSIAKMPQVISIYEKSASPSLSLNEEEKEGFDNEITRLIDEKRISYSFRPIYDCKRMKVYGYISRFTPINSSFASAAQMRNYAIRMNCLPTLFSNVLKHTAPKFVAERSNKEHRLFLLTSMDEREVAIPILMRSRVDKESNLYLTYRADDIQNGLDSLGVDNFLAQTEKLKEKGIRLALVFDNNVFNLDSQIYENADAFFVDLSSEENNANLDARVRSELHVLVEGLLKYKKPIIASNLATWNIVEVVVRSGIDYISSDIVAPYEKMIKPLPPKSVEKIKFMKEGN